MTKLDKWDIDTIFDDLERQEKDRCARYIGFNPDDKEYREKIMMVYIAALSNARCEIEKIPVRNYD